jgi:hypothetical protein
MVRVMREFFPFVNPVYLPITRSKKATFFQLRPRIDSADDIYKGTENDFNYFEYGDMGIPEDGNNTNCFLGKKRKKFDYIYDYLLMVGLVYYGKKNLDLVQRLWLDSKSQAEIKHRIKNLTCQKAPTNVIKTYKILGEALLTQVIIINK